MLRLIAPLFSLTVCLSLAPFSLAWGEETPEPKPSDMATSQADKKPAKIGKLFDGKSLKGWKVNDKGFYSEHGKVTVKNGEIHLAQGNPATGIVLNSQPPTMNYELRLKAKRTEGSDFFCGLTFPVGETHQTLIVGGWGGGVTGLSNIDGMTAVENETTGYTEFENDKWYKVRVRVTPNKIQVWIDKEEIIHLATEGRTLDIWIEQDTSKPLGIGTWYTSSALRNLEIERLK